MDTNKLLLYEAPWITEFISINWVQNLVARYIAYKVNRKVKRYNFRIDRQEFFEKLNKYEPRTNKQ